MRKPSLGSTSVAVDRNIPNTDMDSINIVAGEIDAIRTIEANLADLGVIEDNVEELVEVAEALPDVATVEAASDLVNNLDTTVEMLAGGEVPTTSVSGHTIAFGIPIGDTGVQGEQGVEGPIGKKVVPDFAFEYNDSTGDIDYTVTYTEE